MSKKFQKINLTSAKVDERSIQLDFSSVKKDFLIVDADFSDAKTFLTQAKNWLSFNHQHILYYLCLLPQGFEFKPSSDCSLSLELAQKWPPLLPGLHLVELAGGKIQLIVGLGEPDTLLKSLLWYSDLAQEKNLRYWSVDAWFLAENINYDLVEQFSHVGSVFYPTPRHVLKNKGIDFSSAMPWAFPKHTPDGCGELIIIGAGLAGCFLAHTMALSGWKVKVLEAQEKPAMLGSGNAFSVLYPKISLHHAPFTELLHLSYPFAYSCWKKWLDIYPHLGKAYPLWQQADEFHQEICEFLDGSKKWFSNADDGLLFHHSLIMDMPKLCETLLEHPNIRCYYGISVKELRYMDDCWQVGDFKAPICILANGFQAFEFSQASYLGMKGMRGQMTHTKAFHKKELIYCQQGHFLPQWRGLHALGASFVPNDLSLEASAVDDEKNLKSWRAFFNRDLQASGSWVGIRGVSLDHLPIVGPLCDQDSFYEDFSIWLHHANYKLPNLMPNLPGLYAFTAFGARGLLTIPRLAYALKAMIEKKPVFLPTTIMQAISPARFLRKKIVRKKL